MRLIDLAKVIPKKRQSLVVIAVGFALLVIVIIAVLFQGRSVSIWGIQIGRNEADESNKRDLKIEQSTRGANSPAVGGVQGDVNMNIEQKK